MPRKIIVRGRESTGGLRPLRVVVSPCGGACRAAGKGCTLAERKPMKDLNNLRPIDHAVIARPHTPVYKMHRYFARRPWSVFRALIEHYSNPGSIILDPFCGGGVTVVEGLRLGRKVIGVDINPLATFVTRMEAMEVDLGELRAAFELVAERCRTQIETMYLATCPHCRARVPADWFEWSKAYETPELGLRAVIADCKKVSDGLYEMKHGKQRERFRPLECKRLRDVLISVHVICSECGTKSTSKPSKDDEKSAERWTNDYDTIVATESLPIPDEAIPDMNMARENALFKRGITRFRHLFTARNLIANGRLKLAILSLDVSPIIRDFLGMAFSGSLRFTNGMVFRNEAWRGDKPLEWAKPAFWIPELSMETNVWTYFQRRLRPIQAAKKYTQLEIKPAAAESSTQALNATPAPSFAIVTGSSDTLPIADGSVDVIITDPPYGGNVQYLELSDFWVVWLHEWIDVDGVTDKKKEAITTRHRGFKGEKDIRHYRSMLHCVFKECHRVLKRGRWMVMTFHCREFKVWSALHLAAHDAGFVMAEHDGMIHQPAVKLYEHTINLRRQGSMLGDFILSFQKVDKPPEFRAIEHAEIGRNIERLAAEAVIYHNGATLSTIYMKLIPWLLNNNLLEEIGEKEVEPFLSRNFEERDGKWFVKSDPDQALREDLEHYSQQHYKTSYGDAMQIVPVEARLEFLIRRLLYRKGQATQDEVLNEIYTNLINSNAAEYGEIQRVLTRIAQLRDSTEGLDRKAGKGTKKRKVWRLREDIAREELFTGLGVDVKCHLPSTEESDHDLAIARLVEIGGLRGLKAHIGRQERMKYTDFRKFGDLPKRVAGMPKAARDIIEQIDVLWHNGGRGIVAAFEVERTTTITSGIDRFRNLLASAPDAAVDLYIVVPKARGNEVRAKIGSPANRADGLHRRIGYIYLEDLQITKADPTVVQFDRIVRHVNGNGGK